MKRIALLLCFSANLTLGFTQINDPVLVRIGNKDITKSEFQYSWNKNNSNAFPDKRTLDEYVDLFVNFKLKVLEAEAEGIDTTSSFINELRGYRRQLTEPYLTDKNTEEALINKAYDRIKEYSEVSHILLRIGCDASPKDTLSVYQHAMNVYKRAINGEDFAKLAKEFSEDRSSNDGGYLGFTTGCHLPYPFENAAYDIPVGGVSKPVRTQDGYHIVKVHSRRPAPGQYRSGHILKVVPQNASPEEQTAAKDSIYKIYNALKNGESFQKYATERSDDHNAASRNGEYNMMYCGSLPIEYENAVFKLKVGEFSEPFLSKYGWHIVKALEFKPYPDLEQMREGLSNVIARDERSQIPKKTFVERLKKEYNYTFYKENFEPFIKAFEEIGDSGDSTNFKSLFASEVSLFTLNDQNFTQKQFSAFLSHKKIVIGNLNESYSDFVQDRVMAYEDSQLENKYPEFRHLMQEYRDGILLFDISNKEVWEKASKDTTGLASFFASNKVKYSWEKPHFKGYIVQCANASVARQAKKMVKKLEADSITTVLKRTFNNDSITLVKIDHGLYEQGENANVDFLAFKKGNLDTKTGFPEIFIKGYVLEKGPETYNDVCGLVISDYQNYLDAKWLEYLKGKFKVIVYKDIVNSVNKN